MPDKRVKGHAANILGLQHSGTRIVHLTNNTVLIRAPVKQLAAVHAASGNQSVRVASSSNAPTISYRERVQLNARKHHIFPQSVLRCHRRDVQLHFRSRACEGTSRFFAVVASPRDEVHGRDILFTVRPWRTVVRETSATRPPT